MTRTKPPSSDEVLRVEAQGLADAEACRIQELEQRPVAERGVAVSIADAGSPGSAASRSRSVSA